MTRKSRGFHRPAGTARHWVMLEHYLLACPAWRDLSSNARVVYIEAKRRYNGKNNGEIRLSTREAAAVLNASNDTGARAITELIDHGFLVVTEESAFTRKVHIARSYRLTEVAGNVSSEKPMATKEFLKWPVDGDSGKTSVRPIGRHSLSHRTQEARRA
jgi:hypothetical protein